MKSDTHKTKYKKIIAVDFDGTLVFDMYPIIGPIKPEVIEKLKQEVKAGAYIIIWTCRNGYYLDEMKVFLERNRIPYHRINANAPWVIAKWKVDNRKVYADEYWDDKAVKIN